MEVLVVGGTRFAGRAFTERALARGHRVTLLHRGTTGAGLFPEARHLLADRREALPDLRDRRYDAVVDLCGYFPRSVAALVAAVDAGWYGYVSSVSALAEPRPGADEGGARHAPLWPADAAAEVIDGDTYGPLKAACEDAVRDAFGDRACIVRPGFVVGPWDPSDRFTGLVRRAAAGGPMILPGGPADPFQFVDARDLGAFLLHLAEAATGGVFHAVHPRGTTTLGEVVRLAGDPDVAWVDGAWLGAELGDAADEAFPLWDLAGGDDYHSLEGARAAAAGLRCRPVADTVRDTLAWDRDHPEARRPGLDPAREAALRAAWEARASRPPE